ncbi:ribosome rescue protein RqcH [Halogranum rubrum]|uniref:Archaeal Rqc2 homolog aRqcH n=1 Tax=Halogranum salarium B-1 TaxID=1210908 RepID=J3EVX9_9EURY|nr:ribosome rescue protein RqcH [Halogranum salarium]EJN58892.1 RNA-binding protein, snrnp like protein [Halogranum salarium B-1]
MEPKQELSSIDLAALVTELGRYEGAKVDKAYLYGDDLLRLKLRDFDRGRVDLFIEVGDIKRAHVVAPEHVPDAPGRPPNFAMMLRNRLNGADFAGVEQFEFDRILTFKFERGDEDTEIVAELFGQGNLAVLDENREVVSSLETVRLKSRTVAPGSQYEFPQSRINPLDVSYEALEYKMNESDTDVVRTLATQLNLGGLYAEELCTRAGVEKTLDITEAGEEEYRKIYDAIERLKEPLQTGEFDPRVYEKDGNVVDVTPFPLEEYEGLDSAAFDSFNAALDDYFFRLDLSDEAEKGGGGAEANRPDFQEEIEKQKRIIQQQEGAIEGFEEQAQEEREKAELLYANYELADEVLSTVRGAREENIPWADIADTLAEGAEQGIPAAEAVEDVDGSTGTVTITIDGQRIDLDVSMGVEKNADRIYTEAKRVEEKKAGALEAIENTREKLEAVEKRRDEWEASDDEPDEDEDDEEKPDIDWLSRNSIPIRNQDKWYDRFRWFETSDGFLVIGGRNADQNEEIVKKYLNKHDLFFHTQAHGGPVTILKATGPSEPARDVDIPEQSREEAAQFAVAYSSIWKEGRFADDAYMVSADQVSKTPESGEYVEKGSFVVRGDRTYYEDVAAEVAVGLRCEPDTRVVGGPPSAIEDDTETSIRLQPGRYAQNDMAKMLYRKFRERFADQSFVRKVASADMIQEFLPSGGSDIVDGDGN